MELARGDLARILHEACANDADYIFGDSIKALTQNELGVDVTFERSRPRRVDFVIAAEGSLPSYLKPPRCWPSQLERLRQKPNQPDHKLPTA
jgi:hypothetical protein